MDAVISALISSSDSPQPVPMLGYTVRNLAWDTSRHVWKLSGMAGESVEPMGLGEYDAVVATSAVLLKDGAPGHAHVENAGAGHSPVPAPSQTPWPHQIKLISAR